MAWSEKEKPSPLDNQPIPGLLFLDGDLIARTKEPDLAADWAEQYKGLKYPVIVFPSGDSADISDVHPDQPTVAILRAMRLPIYDTRDSAYETAQTLLEPDWRVEKHGENQLDLWLGKPDGEYLRISYDNAQRLMTNMEHISTPPKHTAEQLRSLKDQILERFYQLPQEHQASLALAILRHVVTSNMGEWMLGAVATLYLEPPDPKDSTLVIPAVTRQHLAELDITNRELVSLTDDDLDEIARLMQEAYMNELFWEELLFATQHVLSKKGKPGLP